MFTAVAERGQCHQYLLAALSTLKPGGGSGRRGEDTPFLSKSANVSRYCPFVLLRRVL
jgi:hypothetical protein